MEGVQGLRRERCAQWVGSKDYGMLAHFHQLSSGMNLMPNLWHFLEACLYKFLIKA